MQTKITILFKLC